MEALEIALVPLLKDNYGYLLHERSSGLTGVVDPSEVEPVLEAAEARGWTLTHVLNNHHHPDHTGCNAGLKAATSARVVGPAYDRARIPAIDEAVDEASGYGFGKARAEVLFIPGHTRGHIAFWFKARRALSEAVKALRAEGRFTIPSLLGEEKAANPFLRADDPGLARRVGRAG